MLAGLLPGAIVLGMMFTVGLSAIWIVRRKQRGRRSPLTHQLLRNPGESLRQQVNRLDDKITEILIATLVVPLGLCVAFLLQTRGGTDRSWAWVFFYLVIGLLFALYMIRKLVNVLDERNAYRLGLDAELAVGQELNQLMASGCRVFHDFPAENFNIDHVVVGPAGVYAVETKGRAKPERGKGKDSAKVVFNGKDLRFPEKVETKPLEQAKRQADWLSQWLSSAVGTQVRAQGVLVFPGWFVERKDKGPVKVISGKEVYHLKNSSGTPLNPEMVQRIAHQVEQRCRDVEPMAYRGGKA